MRLGLLIIALLSTVTASATECITVSFTARNFLAARTDAARAVAQSADTLRVTSVLFGAAVREGDTIRVVTNICRRLAPGAEYFVATHCSVGSECQWNWMEVEGSKGYEQYARNRHSATRSEAIEKLRAWQGRRLSTEELQRWLSSADARDSGGDLRRSLVLAVIERIEDLLEFALQAEACDASDSAWLREQGSRIYLERFGRLPKLETLSAYEEWLDSHEGAEDEWDAIRLQNDLELSLENARSWDHTIDCFLRSHREASR